MKQSTNRVFFLKFFRTLCKNIWTDCLLCSGYLLKVPSRQLTVHWQPTMLKLHRDSSFTPPESQNCHVGSLSYQLTLIAPRPPFHGPKNNFEWSDCDEPENLHSKECIWPIWPPCHTFCDLHMTNYKELLSYQKIIKNTCTVGRPFIQTMAISNVVKPALGVFKVYHFNLKCRGMVWNNGHLHLKLDCHDSLFK